MNTKISKSLISINALHSEIEEGYRTCILKGIQVGEHLSNVKKQLPHGKFTGWVKDNLSFTDRMARNYMRLFANKDKLQGADTISEGIKLLATPSDEPISSFDAIMNAYDRLMTTTRGQIELMKKGQWQEAFDGVHSSADKILHQQAFDAVDKWMVTPGQLDYAERAKKEREGLDIQNRIGLYTVELSVAMGTLMDKFWPEKGETKRQSVSVLKDTILVE